LKLAEKKTVETWEQLFTPPEGRGAGVPLEMLLLRKGGQPFLLLPQSSRLRTLALDLYAPQSTVARSMKWGFGVASRVGSTIGLVKQAVFVRQDDPLIQFLAEVAGKQQPQFAMLMGNPNTTGQRFILLIFDSDEKPVAVVKAGAGTASRDLIDHEIKILRNAPNELQGMPKLRRVLVNDQVSAFAMDFFPGASPRADDPSAIHKLLSAWVHPTRTTPVVDLAIWNRLFSDGASKLSPRTRELGSKTLCTVLQHGDFAPWNIRVHEGKWTVLDWERGEMNGMPVWDWLHFVIQPAVLVKRESSERILVRVKELRENPLFVQYAEQTRTRDLIWSLTSAYLDYCIHVTKQTEGLDLIKKTARLLAST
jgi:hypothetical protein